VPEDGKELARFEPGQYVSVKMEIPGEEYVHIRQYSLSDAPGKPYYRISVKREEEALNKPAGKVSTYLHEQIGQGDVVWLSAPAGDFILDTKDVRPVVFISGGVGLTPLLSMLHTVVEKQPSRQVSFIHATQNGDSHAMKQQVEELARKHEQLSVHWCYSRPTEQDKAAQSYEKKGRIDLSWLQQVAGDQDASFYVCGPVPFMKDICSMLKKRGVKDADVHYEFFGPAASL
jgi:nitric oxide dioxygenase